MGESGGPAKFVTERVGGRVIGHALKNVDKESGELGPMSILVLLEDSAGINTSKAEILVPRSFRGRFPIGAYVSVTLAILQTEMELVATNEANEATLEMAKRHAAGLA